MIDFATGENNITALCDATANNFTHSFLVHFLLFLYTPIIQKKVARVILTALQTSPAHIFTVPQSTYILQCQSKSFIQLPHHTGRNRLFASAERLCAPTGCFCPRVVVTQRALGTVGARRRKAALEIFPRTPWGGLLRAAGTTATAECLSPLHQLEHETEIRADVTCYSL